MPSIPVLPLAALPLPSKDIRPSALHLCAAEHTQFIGIKFDFPEPPAHQCSLREAEGMRRLQPGAA